MNDDFNNPFKNLGKRLPPENGKDGAAKNKSLPAPVQEQPKPRKIFGRTKAAQGNVPEDEREDALLFAEAVRNVSPQDMQRHGKRHEHRPVEKKRTETSGDGDSFAALIQAQAGNPAAPPPPGGPQPRKHHEPRSAAVNHPADEAGFLKNQAGERRSLKYLEQAWLQEEQASGPKEASASEREMELFARAMQGVCPVTAGGRDVNKPSAILERPRKEQADPNEALADILNGKLEFALEFTKEYIQGHVLGLDPMVMGKLKAGQYSPEAHIDLHGLNSVQAYNGLVWFIRDAYQRGMRAVTIITGRGRNSPDGIGVLREQLQLWLTREPFKRVVLAFCTAQPCDGGAGAVYVALRKYKKNHGKIHWDRIPSDDELL